MKQLIEERSVASESLRLQLAEAQKQINFRDRAVRNLQIELTSREERLKLVEAELQQLREQRASQSSDAPRFTPRPPAPRPVVVEESDDSDSEDGSSEGEASDSETKEATSSRRGPVRLRKLHWTRVLLPPTADDV